MKKSIIAGLAVFTALTLSVSLAACDQPADQESFRLPATAAQSYSFSAASAGSIIDAMNDDQSVPQAPDTEPDAAPAPDDTAPNPGSDLTPETDQTIPDETPDELDPLDNYMMLAESLLSNGAYSTAYETSDRENYEIKAVIGFSELTGEKIEYVMYYNENNRKTETEEDDGEIETETKADIEGVLVIDGADYAFRGETKSETESEHGSEETEYETQFTVNLGENKFMRVELKSEYDAKDNEREEEFSYCIIENGEVIERCSLELEEERDETEIEFRMTSGSQSQIFYFEQEDGHAIKIKVGSRESNQVYIVRVVTDNDGNTSYVYETKGGNEYRHQRHSDHD